MDFKLALSQGLLKCKKYSPEILLITGIVGVVGAGVMACIATLKVNDIIDEHNENMDKIHEVAAEEREDYTLEDAKKDTTIQYAHTAGKLIKLYGPSVIVAGASIAAILVSNNILRQRCVAIAAAYTATDSAFKAYRKRVSDKYGEEEEQRLYSGESELEITECDEKGKTKSKKVNVVDEVNDYKKYFAPGNPYWENNDDYIQYFFDMKRSYLNKVFRKKGFLTLNEAYRAFGLQETNDGLVVGWVYDRNNPVGDNYIQVYDHKVNVPDENGKLTEVYELDFNCDGLIYDHI